MSIESFNENPAELALNYVEVVNHQNELISTLEEEKALAELDHISEIGNLHGRTYFTQTNKALAIPFSFDRNENVQYLDYSGLTFEGELVTFSIVKIGRLIGQNVVRSLCLTFDKVTTLPLFIELPKDYLLHVPALAVNSITRSD